MTRNPHARWRQPKPVALHPWPFDPRGREHITPAQVVNDHERLHNILAACGYLELRELFRIPAVWPHVMV